MILGVDPGTRTLGWAVVTPRTGRVVELGELFQDETADGTATRKRCVHAQALLFDEIIARHHVTTLAAEDVSLGGPPQARVRMASSLWACWGGLCAIAALRRLELVDVNTRVWQHAVLGEKGKVDYDQVFAALAAFVTGPAAAQLEGIPKGRRTHALDAVGVGVFAALCPDAARVAGRSPPGS